MENYTITKEQVLQLANKAEQGCTSVIESDLKNWFPESFKKVFIVDKWYKTKKEGFEKCLFNFLGEKNKCIIAYGFNIQGTWYSETYWLSNNKTIEFLEATPEEVSAALINEAKKRGFKDGVTISRGDWYSGFSTPKATIKKQQYPISGFEFRNDTLFLDGYTIFYKGNWAQILSQEKTVIPMDKALKIIAKKMKVSPENIEIQY